MNMKEFDLRYEKCSRELKELYMSFYGNEAMYHKLYMGLRMCYLNRSKALRRRDAEKGGTDWYKSGDMLGMMLYIDNFADDLQGVREKIDYLEKANVNYIHLMPFLDTVPERSDGGYAVADFRKVRPDLGDMDDLKALCSYFNISADYFLGFSKNLPFPRKRT